MVILISDETDFKTKNTSKDKEEHFIRKTEQPQTCVCLITEFQNIIRNVKRIKERNRPIPTLRWRFEF